MFTSILYRVRYYILMGWAMFVFLVRIPYLFFLLDDFESKKSLFRIVWYRFFGFGLTISTDKYLAMLRSVSSLFSSQEFLGFKKADLGPIDSSISMFCRPTGILSNFILKQYEYKNIGAKEGDTVIDAGAFCGDTSLYFLEKINRRGKVWAFEFVPLHLCIFEKNIKTNNAEDIIIPVPLSISSFSGKAFYTENEESSRISLIKNVKYSKPVETVTIDDFFYKKDIPVDFIKMDIEGEEYNALVGALQTISKYKPTMAICIYHSLEDFIRIPCFLKSLKIGYKFYLKHSHHKELETVLFAVAR